MSKRPWFRFFPSDWRGGVARLSAVERGVYISMLAIIYDEGHPIKRDDKRLARECGMRVSSFRRCLDGLIEIGKLTDKDGFLSNERAQNELEKSSNYIEIQSTNASSGWEKRKQKQQKSEKLASEKTYLPQPYPQPHKIDDDGIARARATVSDEQRIAEAMAAECGFPTPQDWPPGWCGAPMWVRKCLDDGWPEAVMLATARAVARKKTGGAIEHYRYLEKPLATAVALSRAPLPKVEILPQEVVRAGYGKTSGLDRRLAEQRDAIDALDDLIERERGGGGQTNHGGDDAAECRGSESVRGGDGSTILALSAARRRDGG